MPGDFVKQLQMAKQLEQKAKEAARGRETAEERIQEATALLGKLKGMNASAAETEKLLTLASQNYSEKDYKEALAYAVKSIDASARARKDRMRDILLEAGDLLKRVADLGQPDAETLKAIKKASEAVDEGDLDRAHELSKEAWTMAERNANRVVSDAFGLAQSSLLFAERLELKVDKQKLSLRSCREALESGNVTKSVELIKSLLGTLKGIALDHFVVRTSKIEALLSLSKRFPFPVDGPQADLTKAREHMGHSKMEEAFALLDSAEDSFSRSLANALEVKLREVHERVELVASYGKKVELDDLEGQTRHLERELKYSEAIAVVEQALKTVRSAERDILIHKMTDVQPRLRLANAVRKDIGPAVQKLEEARKLLKEDRFNDALKSTEEASELVEERLVGYDEVERAFLVAQDLRSRCVDLGLNANEGIKSMGSAKRLMLQGDFHEAAEMLKRSQGSFKLSLENHFATEIMRLEMRSATAMRLGADISEESTQLDNLTAKVRKGEFELVHGSMVTISSSIEEKLAAVTGENIRRAESVLSHYAASPEADRAKASLAEAKDSLQKKEYLAAHEKAKAAIAELQAERRKNLDRSISDGHVLLDMAKDLGAESVTLRDRLLRSEELKTLGRLDDASLLAEEVISYGRNIVASEIDHQLTELMQKISLSRKDGVEVGQADNATEQASNALRKNELASAYELTLSARDLLKEGIALHHGLRERLEEKVAMLEEARRSNVIVTEAEMATEHATVLLRSGRYVEARQELEKAELALRRDASPFILESKLKRMDEMAHLRDRMGSKGSVDMLRKMESLDPSDLDRALETLDKLKEQWEREISSALKEEMASCQMEVDKATSAGHSVGHVQQILARGKASLNEGRLADAVRAVELVHGELDQSLQADRKLNDALALAEDSIEQLKEAKVGIEDALVLLEQSRAMRRSGNPTAAADLVDRALERCNALARTKVTALMSLGSAPTREMMEWEDMHAGRKLSDDIEEALGKRRYRHAFLLSRSFREELERVLQDRAQAEDHLRRFESAMNEDAKAGIRSDQMIKARDSARVMMRQGRFVQAMGAMNAAKGEHKALSDMYESRLAEYNAQREALNSLEVLDPRKDNIESLLDQCFSALRTMQFEPASLYLRRARNSLNEFMVLRTNELLWEFGPLHDLIKRLKLEKRFEAEIADIEKISVDKVEPRDLNQISRSVDLVRAGMNDIFQEKREEARRIIEKSSRSDKQTGRAWEIYSDASAQANRGDLWEAFSSLEQSVKAIGQKAGETPEQLKRQISELLENANRYRIELPLTQRAYAEALELQDAGKDPMDQLKKAKESSLREVRGTYPRIIASTDMSGDAIEGRPIDVIITLRNTGDHSARNVKAFVFGDVEVKGMMDVGELKANATAEGRVTVVPMKAGLLSLGLSIKCRPVLTDEDVLFDNRFDMDVK